MGFRDVLNQLKKMKPLGAVQAMKLKQTAMAPAMPNPVNMLAGKIDGKMMRDENNPTALYKSNSARGLRSGNNTIKSYMKK